MAETGASSGGAQGWNVGGPEPLDVGTLSLLLLPRGLGSWRQEGRPRLSRVQESSTALTTHTRGIDGYAEKNRSPRGGHGQVLCLAPSSGPEHVRS